MPFELTKIDQDNPWKGMIYLLRTEYVRPKIKSCHFCGKTWKGNFILTEMENHYSTPAFICHEIVSKYGGHFDTRYNYKVLNIPWVCQCELCIKCSGGDHCSLCSLDGYESNKCGASIGKLISDLPTIISVIQTSIQLAADFKEYNEQEAKSADIFSLIVLLSDDYMAITK